MPDAGLPVRIQSPEERELDLKRNELAKLEADLVEQELQLSTLQAELAAFRDEYLRVVGRRYAELDDLKARIAEVKAARRPSDDSASRAATHRTPSANWSRWRTSAVPWPWTWPWP